MSKLFRIPLLSLILAASPAAEAGCLTDGATYRIDGAEGFELILQKAAEPSAASDMEATLVTPLLRMEFSLTASNGYSFNYLLPKVVKEGEEDSFRLYGFDKALKPTELPQSGQSASRYYFTPELGSALWYSSERQYLPPEMWRLQDCAE